MLILVGAVLYVLLVPKGGMILFALGAFVALMIWAMFLMPTRCDYEVNGRGCSKPVYGKLRGCTYHGRLKRDALWTALRLSNPGRVVRVMWAASRPEARTIGRPAVESQLSAATASPASPSRQTASEALLLVATVVGSVAGVLALFVR